MNSALKVLISIMSGFISDVNQLSSECDKIDEAVAELGSRFQISMGSWAAELTAPRIREGEENYFWFVRDKSMRGIYGGMDAFLKKLKYFGEHDEFLSKVVMDLVSFSEDRIKTLLNTLVQKRWFKDKVKKELGEVKETKKGANKIFKYVVALRDEILEIEAVIENIKSNLVDLKESCGNIENLKRKLHDTHFDFNQRKWEKMAYDKCSNLGHHELKNKVEKLRRVVYALQHYILKHKKEFDMSVELQGLIQYKQFEEAV